jgi:hypothetical protein
MASSLQALQDQYFYLTQNLSDLKDKCETQDQVDALLAQYAASRSNYFSCINKTLQDDDPDVTTLVQQMNTEQKSLKTAVSQLGDIATVINVITEAVKVGTKLASIL